MDAFEVYVNYTVITVYAGLGVYSLDYNKTPAQSAFKGPNRPQALQLLVISCVYDDKHIKNSAHKALHFKGSENFKDLDCVLASSDRTVQTLIPPTVFKIISHLNWDGCLHIWLVMSIV